MVVYNQYTSSYVVELPSTPEPDLDPQRPGAKHALAAARLLKVLLEDGEGAAAATAWVVVFELDVGNPGFMAGDWLMMMVDLWLRPSCTSGDGVQQSTALMELKV